MKKALQLIIGTMITSFGIACVINCGLGAFSITLANMAIAKWLYVDLAIANFITEGLMLAYATYKGEGLGWNAICSATLGSLTISLFSKLLPCFPLICIGMIFMPIGWAITGKCGLGHTGSNILTEALMKATGKSLTFIRLILDGIWLIIAWLGFPDMMNLFTLVLTFGTAPVLQMIYKLFKYEPKEIEHKFLIQLKK